jgi:hypothetical protein
MSFSAFTVSRMGVLKIEEPGNPKTTGSILGHLNRGAT